MVFLCSLTMSFFFFLLHATVCATLFPHRQLPILILLLDFFNKILCRGFYLFSRSFIKFNPPVSDLLQFLTFDLVFHPSTPPPLPGLCSNNPSKPCPWPSCVPSQRGGVLSLSLCSLASNSQIRQRFSFLR